MCTRAIPYTTLVLIVTKNLSRTVEVTVDRGSILSGSLGPDTTSCTHTIIVGVEQLNVHAYSQVMENNQHNSALALVFNSAE